MIPTVLIADDDTALREYLAALFRHRGCHVYAAADGASALRIVQEHAVDFAVVEMLLPGESGFRVLEEMQSLRRGRAVMTSRMGAAEHRDYAAVLGAALYLMKPFTIADVLAVAPPATTQVHATIASEVDTVSAFK